MKFLRFLRVSRNILLWLLILLFFLAEADEIKNSFSQRILYAWRDVRIQTVDMGTRIENIAQEKWTEAGELLK